MKPRNPLEETAFAITRWIGSVPSVMVHTLIFAGSFLAVALNVISFDRMLLLLTTLVSLEAIYLSIFIQMSLNFTRESLAEVEEDIDEIQEDVGEIQEDVGEIQEDVDEIQENVDEIQEEMEELPFEKEK
jgi:septal ring factor EnvC (AmiA/AmiB activator)